MKLLATIGALKLSYYYKHLGNEEIFEKYPGLLNKDVKLEEIDALENFKELSADNEEDARLIKVLAICGDNALAMTIVELALFRYMDERVGGILAGVAPSRENLVTPEIACKVALSCMGIDDLPVDHTDEIIDSFDRLQYCMAVADTDSDLMRAPFIADFRLVSYFAGSDLADTEILDYSGMIYANDPPTVLYGYTDEVVSFAKKLYDSFEGIAGDETAVATSIPTTVVISGEKGCGKYTTVSALREALKLNIFSIDYEFIAKNNKPTVILNKLIKECFLSDAALCIRNIQADGNAQTIIKHVRKKYDTFGSRPLFLLCEPDVKCASFIDGRLFTFDIPKPTPTISFELWNGILGNANVKSKFNIESIASRMMLNAGQIEKVVSAIISEEEGGREVSEHDLMGLCYRVLDDGRYNNIKRVQSGFTLDDVRTSEANKRVLREIIGQVIEREKVYYKWGMAAKYTYGRCVSCILAGPPGTGKTMAVHALSSELGLELYKVDLSQLVDKYIGETEKRLEEVFTKAEKSNMILFFDEADAIMGKRTEANDSKDKYANTEVAYILQRIEEYDGIVILATNYLKNIDPAFMRRIKYVVNMDIPDEATRREIWEGAFAPMVPRDAAIDFEYLARSFELAGGNIKNIVLNATFLAAAEDKPVGMAHIMKAVFEENTKDKRIAFASDYGEYSYLAHN